MDNNIFFYEQTKLRAFPKRFKKMPEDLPDSLKFAHLNPKVAAYLASKEKQKHDEDLFGDGLGKKSLMPEISQAFNAVKNRLDSSLSNDEDSQRYLFEEAKASSGTILVQLGRIIYYYDNIGNLIPRSLEFQMMSSYIELTTDVQVVSREWQTVAMKEAYLRRLTEGPSDDDQDKHGAANTLEDSRSSRAQSAASDSTRNKKRLLAKGTAGLPEIFEDSEGVIESAKHLTKRNESRMSATSRKSRTDRNKESKAHSKLRSQVEELDDRQHTLRLDIDSNTEFMSGLDQRFDHLEGALECQEQYFRRENAFSLSSVIHQLGPIRRHNCTVWS